MAKLRNDWIEIKYIFKKTSDLLEKDRVEIIEKAHPQYGKTRFVIRVNKQRTEFLIGFGSHGQDHPDSFFREELAHEPLIVKKIY